MTILIDPITAEHDAAMEPSPTARVIARSALAVAVDDAIHAERSLRVDLSNNDALDFIDAAIKELTHAARMLRGTIWQV